MNEQAKQEMSKNLEIAIKQLKQAMKNIDKAEEIAFRNRKDKMSDGLEKDAIEVAKIADNLHILNCMVKYRPEIFENEQ